jgi:hypothetical protein
VGRRVFPTRIEYGGTAWTERQAVPLFHGRALWMREKVLKARVVVGSRIDERSRVLHSSRSRKVAALAAFPLLPNALRVSIAELAENR